MDELGKTPVADPTGESVAGGVSDASEECEVSGDDDGSVDALTEGVPLGVAQAETDLRDENDALTVGVGVNEGRVEAVAIALAEGGCEALGEGVLDDVLAGERDADAESENRGEDDSSADADVVLDTTALEEPIEVDERDETKLGDDVVEALGGPLKVTETLSEEVGDVDTVTFTDFELEAVDDVF